MAKKHCRNYGLKIVILEKYILISLNIYIIFLHTIVFLINQLHNK